jgi:transposase
VPDASTPPPKEQKSLRAAEQDRPDVAARRALRRRQGKLDPRRLVFIDETSVSTTITRLYGRAPQAPTLKSGDIVIMDNASVHMVDGVEEVIEARGAIPFYLPAYSPDLNPNEQLFAKPKSMLRKIAAYSLKQAAYTVESLCAAIASSLTKITRSECAAYLANSGYDQSYRETL